LKARDYSLKVKMLPLILSIETATRAGSLAITRGASVLVERQGDAAVSHSTNLLEQIKGALAQTSLSLREVDALAVATGPGSFTGLRIGLATVKSFAATLKLPCVGIPTLHAVALAAGESSSTIALLPAGRGEVYAQRLSVTATGDVQSLDAPEHLAPEILLKKVSAMRSLKWAGDGAHMYIEAIGSFASAEGISFRQKGSDAMSAENEWAVVGVSEALAASVGKLAFKHAPFVRGASPQDLQAIYVRPSDAELNA
jgi:tRNA threonylcarbamoyladenosine biosynthesis protein TsaB